MCWAWIHEVHISICFLYDILFICFLRNHPINTHFMCMLYSVAYVLDLMVHCRIPITIIEDNCINTNKTYPNTTTSTWVKSKFIPITSIVEYGTPWCMEKIFERTCCSSHSISKELIINLPSNRFGWLHTLRSCSKTLIRPIKFPLAKSCMCFWTHNKIFIQVVLSFLQLASYYMFIF